MIVKQNTGAGQDPVALCHTVNGVDARISFGGLGLGAQFEGEMFNAHQFLSHMPKPASQDMKHALYGLATDGICQGCLEAHKGLVGTKLD